MESAQQDFAQRTEAQVKVPASAVIWETFVAEGTSVTAGGPLFSYVDCTQRLTQATVDDSTSELIRPQHPVTVYLYGEGEPLAGKVHSIYGSAAQIARSRSLAANVEEVGTTDAIVLIEITAASELARDLRLCDIGRTAYVEFDGIGFLDPFLNRLW
jgi:multidrug resistance efflux pump